jgi:transposase
MAKQASIAMGEKDLTAVADRGYFKGEEILACEKAGITVIVPKPLTSGSKAEGRFGKQDVIYEPDVNAYRCPAGQRLIWRFASVENGMTLHSYWSSGCQVCALHDQCTTGKERRVKRSGARGGTGSDARSAR